MAKAFYTEKDIEALVQGGVQSLEVTDAVVLTELAYEKAHLLGLMLVLDRPDAPPSAPVRPYISKVPAARPATTSETPQRAVSTPAAAAPPPQPGPAAPQGDLAAHIRSAVIARLGSQVEPALLDAIIQRVLSATGMH